MIIVIITILNPRMKNKILKFCFFRSSFFLFDSIHICTLLIWLFSFCICSYCDAFDVHQKKKQTLSLYLTSYFLISWHITYSFLFLSAFYKIMSNIYIYIQIVLLLFFVYFISKTISSMFCLRLVVKLIKINRAMYLHQFVQEN